MRHCAKKASLVLGTGIALAELLKEWCQQSTAGSWLYARHHRIREGPKDVCGKTSEKLNSLML